MKNNDNRCTRCNEPLEPRTTKWLELSNTDGNYYDKIPEGHISQGCFPFGTSCASVQLRESIADLKGKMRAPQHTPGPWYRNTAAASYLGPSTDDAKTILAGRAICICELGESDEKQANANLIAAAPDMLAALEMAEAVMTDDIFAPTLNAIRAAIAKAAGQQ